jgi:hypothetical protein
MEILTKYKISNRHMIWRYIHYNKLLNKIICIFKNGRRSMGIARRNARFCGWRYFVLYM